MTSKPTAPTASSAASETARCSVSRSTVCSAQRSFPTPPETSTSWEVGAKFDLFDGVTANISLFDIHKRNVMYSEIVGDETVAKTAGRVRSQGVEMDIAGALTSNSRPSRPAPRRSHRRGRST